MAKKRQTKKECFPTKPRIEERSLISINQAGELEALFKVLGNNTRLRILHALVRAGYMCVSDLAGAVRMKSQAVSNQLQRLVDREYWPRPTMETTFITALLTSVFLAF